MEGVQTWAWVAAGGALGSVARHAAVTAASAVLGERFPWGTLAVNVVGSALLGYLVGRAVAGRAGEGARLFLGTGFLGGFTTFSAFSAQVVELWRAGAVVAAAGYAVGSATVCVVAAAAGMALGAGRHAS